jgi:adenylate kinase family enzyme
MELVKGGEHLVFDGSPRSLNEALVLDSALSFYGYQERRVILLDVSEQWAIDRLTARGRVDDGLPDIKRRLAWYEKDVKPAVEFYQTAPGYRFLKLNGEQTVDEVHRDILRGAL